MKHTACYPEITAPRWGLEECEYQIVAPRKPYVYGTARNNALMHVISHVRLRWWTYGPYGHYLVRLQSPRMTAVTKCQRYIAIDSTKGKICKIPRPGTLLCAACLGKGRNFPRGVKHAIPIEKAKVSLGCVESVL